MQGLNEIHQRPDNNFEPTDRNAKVRAGVFPNLKTRNTIREVCASILETIGITQWTDGEKDAFAFGYVRGALDNMKRDENPAAAAFAAALLVQVNDGGVAAIRKIVLEVTGYDFRG